MLSFIIFYVLRNFILFILFSLRRGSAPPSALSGEIISEQEILQSAVTATAGGYLAVGTGHMTGIRKNSQPDLRKTSIGNNGHIARGKGHEKSGGLSFLGLNVGRTKSRSSSVPRGSELYANFLAYTQFYL